MAKQMSDSLRVAVLLALSGGFMDAYSYLGRGQVFANAQTGNIMLLGIHLSRHNGREALSYLLPVLAFALGITIAYLSRIRFGNSRLHWRQAALLAEMLALGGVCFLPQSLNLLANSLTSLACGIQVESFRKFHGYSAATTMCIGNLRNATQSLCEYARTRERQTGQRGLMYLGIILCFVAGALLGSYGLELWKEKALVCCVVLLGIASLLMIKKET